MGKQIFLFLNRKRGNIWSTLRLWQFNLNRQQKIDRYIEKQNAEMSEDYLNRVSVFFSDLKKC